MVVFKSHFNLIIFWPDSGLPGIQVDLNRFLIPSIEGFVLKSNQQEMTADKNPCSSSLVISSTYHVSIELDGSKLFGVNN